MRKNALAVFYIILTMIILTGCGPKNDTTDPLSGYDVDVNLPFATAQPGSSGSLTTPEPSVHIGWNGETVVIPADEYTELSQGSIGTKVKNLQKRLIELGYMTGTATGTFDNATTLAVKRFESMYNQTQTGIATPLMQHYLFDQTAKIYNGSVNISETNSTATASYRTLQRGDSGEDVLKLKRRLTELGYMTSAEGNYFDSATENGIKALEGAYGQTRTGIATIEMQKFLYSTTVKSAWQIAAEATPVPSPTPTPAPWQFYNELSKGDSGTEVRNLQNRLRELGYMTAKADGKYGDKTVEAVKAFEAMYGKVQTGVATAQLQYYLYDDSALPAATVTATPAPDSFDFNTYTMLSYGSYGDEVVMLQERLRELGYLQGKADGYYGKDTQAAVSAFEAAYGRVETGVATATLQEYLFSENAIGAVTNTTDVEDNFYNELSLGSYGSDVNALQQRLAELGYYYGTISGYYDENTENAVKAFEAAYNRTATGIATELLQSYLYSDSARRNPSNNNASNYTSLKKGDKGDMVAQLQRRLIELGYLAGTVDGYYGDGTSDAIKVFEAAMGQKQTGVASATVQAALYSNTAVYNPSGSVAYSFSTLEKGDKGDSVTMLQNRLIELGYMSGKASGTYDTATVNAVKAFQKSIGLSQTGTATSALQRELFSSNASTSNEDDDTVITVNKKAYVSVAETYVYSSVNTNSSYSVIKIGTEVTVLRTRGIWAEIRDTKGNTGYALLENFTYTAPSNNNNAQVVNVNKQAVVSVEKLVVFEQASDDSKKLGTLSQGTYITWLRTKGNWAEIQNSSGSVGYVHADQITAISSADLPGGTDSDNVLTVYTTLSYNSKGDDVKKLQTRLKALGYFSGDIGGNYLEKTKTAVEAFEAAIGLTPTGVATPGLQDIMFSKAAPKSGKYAASTQYSFSGSLSYGQQGDSVGELQKQLVSLGYLSTSGTKFATYDENTAVAVMEVQEAMGLQNIDGIATRELQAFVFSNASKAIAK